MMVKDSEQAALNMLLWHTEYFELKTFEKQQMQKGLSGFPFSVKKQVTKLPMRKFPSLYKERTFLSLKSESWSQMDLYK